MIDIENTKNKITSQKLYTKELWDSHHLGSYEYKVFSTDFILTALTELDRLQKKEIPMEVLNNNDPYVIGICPICKKEFEVYEDDEYDYCPHCGQKLDWSDEK